MNLFNFFTSKNTKNTLRVSHSKFRKSIYGQMIYIILFFSVFLFVSFGVIFKSVNKKYMQSVIAQSGNMVGSIVQGALYRSMLKNDKKELQNILSVMSNMSSIDGIHIYDKNNNLVTSSSKDPSVNPKCQDCHTDIDIMLPPQIKSYKVINLDSECSMNQKHFNAMHLLIRSPILNEKSCYTSTCHVHNSDERVLGSMVIISPLKDINNSLESSSTDFYILAILTTILLVTILILFTGKKIKKPLNAIIKASEAVSKGDKNAKVEIIPNLLDDIRSVSVVFAKMIGNLVTANIELENWSRQLEYKVQKKSEEILKIHNKLIHTERIVSLGKLSSSVAHEINNPLSGVLTYTKLVHKQLSKIDIEHKTKESMLRYLKMSELETKRCGDIVKGLLDFSKKDNEDLENEHLHKILKDTYNLISHQMKISNINFYTDFSAENDVVNCNENQIKQACIAILVNASEAVSENGEVIIKTCNPDENHIRIDITDNGVGISPNDIPHIFEPFFSAKHKEIGIGLGLAIAYGIIQSHSGKIEVESQLGIGTTIIITFSLQKIKK